MYILTYWSGSGPWGSEAWSFMWGDYNENRASISLLESRGAQWLSGLFSLTGRWKWELVLGRASLRENLDWDINKGLKSEGNHSSPISHGWKRVIFQSAIHISHLFHSCPSHFHETPSHTNPQLKQEHSFLKPERVKSPKALKTVIMCYI